MICTRALNAVSLARLLVSVEDIIIHIQRMVDVKWRFFSWHWASTGLRWRLNFYWAAKIALDTEEIEFDTEQIRIEHRTNSNSLDNLQWHLFRTWIERAPSLSFFNATFAQHLLVQTKWKRVFFITVDIITHTHARSKSRHTDAQFVEFVLKCHRSKHSNSFDIDISIVHCCSVSFLYYFFVFVNYQFV